MKPNFKDKRGTITDLIVNKDYSITHITFKRGAVRGNHYHNKTDQIDLILKGKLVCSQDGIEVVVSKGASIGHPRGVRHAYKAITNSEMVSICFGVRKGTNYEKDVIRLIGKDKLL